MKRILLISICLLITATAFQSCKPSDEKVLSKVEKALKDNSYTITPTVSNGIVTLIGSVGSEQERLAIESTVRSVEDVKSVNNNITVISNEPGVVINQDETILSIIQTKLNSRDFKDVNVDVKEGVVTLTGDIKRINLDRVMQFVTEANPKKINNQLTLK